MTEIAVQRAHRLRRMTGRDPDEEHRAATPLELLYDLTFVVAFGEAANQLTTATAKRSKLWGAAPVVVDAPPGCGCCHTRRTPRAEASLEMSDEPPDEAAVVAARFLSVVAGVYM